MSRQPQKSKANSPLATPQGPSRRAKKRAMSNEELEAYKREKIIKALAKKIDGVDPAALRTFAKCVLVDLFMLEFPMPLLYPMSRGAAEAFLDDNMRWLGALYLAVRSLLAQSRPVIEQEAALPNILELHDLLSDLKDGSENVFTQGLKRTRGDRRDNRRIRETKDQAARTYKFLASIGASPKEATDAINAALQGHLKLRGLHNKIPIFEIDALRKRAAKVGGLPEHQLKDTLEMLGRPGPPFAGNLPTRDPEKRSLYIRASCTHLIMGFVKDIVYLGE